MNHKSVHQKLEDIARNQLGIGILHKSQMIDTHTLTNHQIEKALKAAYLMGERNGYKHGYEDASHLCECSMEEIISPIEIDKTNIMV